MTITQKRFIAGAVCPRCGALDKLVMFRDGGHVYRECVSCAFADEILAHSPTQLETRVDRAQGQTEAGSEPLKFFNPADHKH